MNSTPELVLENDVDQIYRSVNFRRKKNLKYSENVMCSEDVTLTLELQ
jgi:hypothetical protein